MSPWKFEAVNGFFIQDTDVRSIALPARFGLIDDSGDRWKAFRGKIDKLNQDAEDGVVYKVFWLSRHGEGYHNVGEAKYGTEAWDVYWSKLNGDGEITWGPDAEITPLGISQAEAAHSLWTSELALDIPVPLPEKFYSSPLSRAIRTGLITFEAVFPKGQNLMIIENCREQSGEHTCDKRSTRTYIARTFPTVSFEEGFAEEDELWKPDVRESKDSVMGRARLVLERIFCEDVGKSYISITAHGGIINGFLNVLGRPDFGLSTGGILPVVVKANKL